MYKVHCTCVYFLFSICLPHLSAVATCMGVLPVPGLMAANGPLIREDPKPFTVTLLLLGLLFTEGGEARFQVRKPIHYICNSIQRCMACFIFTPGGC